ncbi:hypothetical protein WOLCODRAFT_160764 [Wolfiporia cocos MD-104 SS10]|uniref:Uncharacterized protein n=1 Tax=Wolfiporia cocos (strain MD-104) TaxID=742152 RepID=A0A2H3J9F1_WOLCO|nr:hypothetical protein WOLCODRAFT_160764 [Wolfiporia cocos MD-104 SS10]
MSQITAFATRTAFKRAAVAHKPSIAVCTPRFYASSTHENDPHLLETEKRRNLTGQQHKTSTTMEHAPGWNEYLASASEAAVKADGSDGTLEELQHRTVKHIKDRHHSNESPIASPREQATNTKRMADGEGFQAVYERDEVSGPLSGAVGTEYVEEHIEKVVKRPAAAK